MFTWKWDLSPQTIISVLNLGAIVFGLFSYFATRGADFEVQKQQLQELRTVVATLQATQASQALLLAETKTKVDMLLPLVQKIEERLRPIHLDTPPY